MAEDCIRWGPFDGNRTRSRTGAFEIRMFRRSQDEQRVWVLEWKREVVGRFEAMSEAKGCAEDILRVYYGLVTREEVEQRHCIDLSQWLGGER